MAKTPRAGEQTTANYGWTKPTVGASDDAWGGYINSDLDGIDSVVHGIDARTASAPYVPQAGYVPAIGDNRIINGDMRIDQRNNGATGMASAYTIDRWAYASSQVGKGTWGRNIGSPVTPPGFPYCLGFASAAVYGAAAGEVFTLQQPIEADMISDFAWGTSSAQPVTLSFWVLSNKTGAFGGNIRTYAAGRTYPFIYTIPVASVWTKIAITIPGDTSGTWVLSGNGGGAWLGFDLGSGSNNAGPANTWASASYITASGLSGILAQNGYIYWTGVKLETGTVATPFNRQSLAKSMADCQRYYATGQIVYGAYAVVSEGITCSYSVPVTMRAAPTLNITDTSPSNGISTPTMGAANARDVFAQATAVTTGEVVLNYKFTASAEI